MTLTFECRWFSLHLTTEPRSDEHADDAPGSVTTAPAITEMPDDPFGFA